MSIFNALKKAKGLGSAGNGTHHFIVQRTTAIILIPVILYFFYAIIRLTHAADYAAVGAWFNNPFNAGLSLTFIIVGYYHAILGVQVVIEDYVHTEKVKWLSLIALNGICLCGAMIALISIVRLAIA